MIKKEKADTEALYKSGGWYGTISPKEV